MTIPLGDLMRPKLEKENYALRGEPLRGVVFGSASSGIGGLSASGVETAVSGGLRRPLFRMLGLSVELELWLVVWLRNLPPAAAGLDVGGARRSI